MTTTKDALNSLFELGAMIVQAYPSNDVLLGIADKHETIIRNALQTQAELVEALRLVLPLAKGYAHQNRVGSNAKYITIAENAIAKTEKTLASADGRE